MRCIKYGCSQRHLEYVTQISTVVYKVYFRTPPSQKLDLNMTSATFSTKKASRCAPRGKQQPCPPAS